MEETLVHGDPEKQHGKMAQRTKRGPHHAVLSLYIWWKHFFSLISLYPPSLSPSLSLSLSQIYVRTCTYTLYEDAYRVEVHQNSAIWRNIHGIWRCLRFLQPTMLGTKRINKNMVTILRHSTPGWHVLAVISTKFCPPSFLFQEFFPFYY